MVILTLFFCMILKAMSLMAYPSNAVDAFQSLANMTDDIWYHSNDTSTDVSKTSSRPSIMLSGLFNELLEHHLAFTHSDLREPKLFSVVKNEK